MTLFENGPLVTASAFSAVPFIEHWISGRDGKWLDRVERFIERKQMQGVQGGRVFGETTGWGSNDSRGGEHPFFGGLRATSDLMWDYDSLRVGIRPEKLTHQNQLVILTLVELARKHDFKWNYVTDATLKHTEGIGWNMIGHCIRQTAHFFGLIHNAESNEDTLAYFVDLSLRQQFEDVKGPIDHLILHETHNEWDAHSRSAWLIDGLSVEDALWEVNMQLSRHRRWEQWSQGLVTVSHGGRDDVDYRIGRPQGADVISVHPERAGEWDRVEERFAGLEASGLPIYLNETKHYIDPDWWWVIEQGWFGERSSTKDAGRLLGFMNAALERGYSFCQHSLVNMACGVWVESGHPEEMPLDELEEATAVEPPRPPRPPMPPGGPGKIHGERREDL